MLNAQWQIPVTQGSVLHIPPTSYHLLAAQQKPYNNNNNNNNNNNKKPSRIFWRSKKKTRKKKNTEIGIMDYKVKNLKTERARGLGRKKKKKKGDRKGESNDSPEIPDRRVK